MFYIIGLVIVVACVLGGYMAMGGKLGVLNQPFEYVIILGAGIGGFVASNPLNVIKGAVPGYVAALKGPQRSEDHTSELQSH